MNEQLFNLIESYQAKAREYVPLVAKHLGVELPIANIQWSILKIEREGTTKEGIEYCKHGFGVRITYPGGTIDVDFGMKGEFDGFDAWRLFWFAEDNNIQIPYKDYEEIEKDLVKAVINDELRYSGHVLYHTIEDCDEQQKNTLPAKKQGTSTANKKVVSIKKHKKTSK